MVIWIPLLANSLNHHGDTEYTEVHGEKFPLCTSMPSDPPW